LIITDVECIVVRLPKVEAIGDGTQDSAIVRVHTDEGLVGLGEAHTSPFAIKQIIEAPISGLAAQGLRGLVVGESPLDVRPLWDRMYRYTMNYGRRGVLIHALSAIDMACWDLLGKATGQSIATLLGGSYRDRVQPYASALSPESPEGAVMLAKQFADDGFPAIKLGWGGLGKNVRNDLELVERVRSAVGDEIELMIDFGMPVTFDYARQMSQGLVAYDIKFLEEPFSGDDLDSYARLGALGGTPIAMGERESTRFGFKDIIERAHPSYIQPDVARAGGFTESQRIADLAEVSGITVLPHCWSNDILVGATLHFIASLAHCPYLEFCVRDNPIRLDLVTEPIRVVDGMVSVPTGPGLGLELNEAVVDELRVA
jgi:L-alanine-DL-glutamate epimerase-like enolase superfamily enzyme